MTPSPAAPLVARMMKRALQRAFRRVCWVGALPELPPSTPVVLFANHHNFYDGYLAWLLTQRVLRRPSLTWMAEWDRFPFFGAVGALPFPPDDPHRRAATLRHTIRRFRADPDTILVYFPEGALHRPDDGLLPIDADAFARLDHLLPKKLWWPVGIHTTWWGEARPTALLGSAAPYPTATGREAAHLEAAWHTVRTADPQQTRSLLEGRHSPDERWNLTFLRRFFEPRL